jgi:hypothetical protein
MVILAIKNNISSRMSYPRFPKREQGVWSLSMVQNFVACHKVDWMSVSQNMVLLCWNLVNSTFDHVKHIFLRMRCTARYDKPLKINWLTTNFRQWNRLTGNRRLIVYVVKFQIKNIKKSLFCKYAYKSEKYIPVCSSLVIEVSSLKNKLK